MELPLHVMEHCQWQVVWTEVNRCLVPSTVGPLHGVGFQGSDLNSGLSGERLVKRDPTHKVSTEAPQHGLFMYMTSENM